MSRRASQWLPMLCGMLWLGFGCGAELSEREQWWREAPPSATHLAFEQNGKWGFKNRAGEVVVPPRFDYAASFPGTGDVMAADGKKTVHYVVSAAPLGRVMIGKRWGYVDGAGEIVIPPQFDAALDFFEDQTAVKIGDRWGYIDRGGKPVIAPRFELASPFLLGVAHVKENGKWRIIDRAGNPAASGEPQNRKSGDEKHGD